MNPEKTNKIFLIGAVLKFWLHKKNIISAVSWVVQFHEIFAYSLFLWNCTSLLPVVLPRTKIAFKIPIWMYISASSLVNCPVSRKRSTNATAMAPSTFKIKLLLFAVVIFSTSRAKSNNGHLGNWVLTKSLTMVTLASGFSNDFTLWPIHSKMKIIFTDSGPENYKKNPREMKHQFHEIFPMKLKHYSQKIETIQKKYLNKFISFYD